MKIGIDLDNTIINYDSVFYTQALAMSLIDSTFNKSKDSIRTHVRKTAGENSWVALQEICYGPAIYGATIPQKAKEAMAAWKAGGIELVIISHKTNFSKNMKYNLHTYAHDFLKKNGIFNSVSEECIFFCETRARKLQMISAQCCDYFIDDLVEIFLEPLFPEKTKKILLTEQEPHLSPLPDGMMHCRSWNYINDFFPYQDGKTYELYTR